MSQPDLSLAVIIPANNEAGYIGPCLEGLITQGGVRLRIIVSANACNDATVAEAQAMGDRLAAAGHDLTVIDRVEPGKIGALNAAEDALGSEPGARAYLDADVRCDPGLMAALAAALAGDAPRYATGTLAVMRAQSWVTRAYARFWQRLPFVQGGAVGAGLFAFNAAGRARWGAFPDIISDDTFVRLQFEPAERVELPQRYHWPMVEGLRRLIRVRRRQDQGVAEIARLYPEIMGREAKIPMGAGGLMRRALRDPVGFAVYAGVALAVRLGKREAGWTRGR